LAEDNEIKVENNTPTAEDYEALKAELEAEKQKAQTAVSEATQALTEKVATLEAQVTTYATDAQALQEKLDLVNKDFEGAKAAYAYAVEDFRKLVLATNPLFTPDIIGGDTIDAVKASVEKAGVLVGKVKEGLEAQAKALAGLTTVPAGAPVRSQTNTEGLSTKEKINLGLEQARKRKES
jgi:hypothetical protein